MTALFDDYDGAFFVDLDNDCVEEIYARSRGGRANSLIYTIFKRSALGYSAIAPEKQYANFELIGQDSGFSAGLYELSQDAFDDITFIRLGEKMFVVTAVRQYGGRTIEANPRITPCSSLRTDKRRGSPRPGWRRGQVSRSTGATGSEYQGAIVPTPAIASPPQAPVCHTQFCEVRPFRYQKAGRAGRDAGRAAASRLSWAAAHPALRRTVP